MDYFKKEFGKSCIHVTFAWDEEAKGEIKDFNEISFCLYDGQPIWIQ